MSNEAITWAYGQLTGCSAGCKAVLVALADKADESHSCYPGQETLALMTEQSERSVRTHVKHLEEAGFFRREMRFNGRDRTSDRYILAVGVQVTQASGLLNRKNQPPENLATGNLDVQPATDVASNRRELPGNPQGEPSDRALRHSGDEGAKANARIALPSGLTIDTAFDQFWDTYPRKHAKGSAKVKFVAALRRGVDFTLILEGAKRFARDPNLPEDQFIPHPSTWLFQQRWADETPLPERTEARRQISDTPKYDATQGRTIW